MADALIHWHYPVNTRPRRTINRHAQRYHFSGISSKWDIIYHNQSISVALELQLQQPAVLPAHPRAQLSKCKNWIKLAQISHQACYYCRSLLAFYKKLRMRCFKKVRFCVYFLVYLDLTLDPWCTHIVHVWFLWIMLVIFPLIILGSACTYFYVLLLAHMFFHTTVVRLLYRRFLANEQSSTQKCFRSMPPIFATT